MLQQEQIYNNSLKIINNIKFTNREIDILAFILSGRTSKKIAAFFNVSPSTIESHLRNIMIKTGCNSRNQIVEFIEGQGKLLAIQQYYSQLVLRKEFIEQAKVNLKKIQSLEIKLIILSSDLKNDLVCQLEKDLSLSGVTVCKKHWKKEILNSHIKNTTTKQNYLICGFISNDLDELEINHSVIAVEIKKLLQNNINHFVWLQLNKQEDIEITSNNIKAQVFDPENYYLLLCNLLKNLSEDEQINIWLQKFIDKLQDNTFNELPIERSEDQSNIAGSISCNSTKNPKKTTLIISMIFLLGVFFSTYILSEKYSHIINFHKKVQPLKSFPNEAAIKEWNLPYYFEYFTQRTKLTDEIWNKLLVNNIKDNTAIIVGLYGLGGVGKTSLAMDLIHNSKNNYIFKGWFQAKDDNSIIADYFAFGKKLNLFAHNMSNEEKISVVIRWLENYKNILLVYDNAPNFEAIKKYLPKYGHIIITSRNFNLPRSLEIDVMELQESIELLDKILPDQLKKQVDYKKNAEALVRTLGYLPLAIVQAGGYMANTMITIDNYLKLYNTKHAQLLSSNIRHVSELHEPAYITWNINYNSLKNTIHFKKELELLKFCSICYFSGIPKDLLIQILYQKITPENQIEFDKILVNLRQSSLIKISDLNDVISIHPLVQLWLLDKITTVEKNDFVKKGIIAISELASKTYKINKHPQLSQILITHIETMLQHIRGRELNEEMIQLMTKVVNLYGLINNYEKQLDILHKLLSIQKKLYKKENLNIAATLINIADVYWKHGKYQLQYEALNNALIIKQHYYSADSIEIANILEDLGNAYWGFGDFNKQKEFQEKALFIKEKYYGTEHLEIVKTLENIGNAYWGLGDYNKQKEFQERALNIKLKQSSPNDLQLAIILENLGNAYFKLGNYKKQLELQQQALAIKKNIYGENHLEIARTLSKLSNAYWGLKKYSKQQQLLEKALFIKKQYPFLAEISIARTTTLLGIAEYELGNYNRSKDLLTHSLKIKNKYYNNTDNINITLDLDYLGNVFGKLGDLKKQIELQEKSLIIKKSYYGVDHIETAQTLRFLSVAYDNLGNHKKQ